MKVFFPFSMDYLTYLVFSEPNLGFRWYYFVNKTIWCCMLSSIVVFDVICRSNPI